MPQRQRRDTIAEIEESQKRLRESIDSARRLADKSQELLDRHRQETEGGTARA